MPVLEKISSNKHDVFHNKDTLQLITTYMMDAFLRKHTKTTNLITKFNRDINTPCWVYNNNYNIYKYSAINITIPELNKKIRTYAHISSYLIHYGYIPKGTIVRHLCRHACCVNPYHLCLGDRPLDSDDQLHHKLNPKLNGRGYESSTNQVRRIRELYYLEAKSINEIIKIMKIKACKVTIYDIIRFKTHRTIGITV